MRYKEILNIIEHLNELKNANNLKGNLFEIICLLILHNFYKNSLSIGEIYLVKKGHIPDFYENIIKRDGIKGAKLDYGADILIVHENGNLSIVQCKAHKKYRGENSTNILDVKEVVEAKGFHVRKVILMVSSTYTSERWQSTDPIRMKIDLDDYRKYPKNKWIIFPDTHVKDLFFTYNEKLNQIKNSENMEQLESNIETVPYTRKGLGSGRLRNQDKFSILDPIIYVLGLFLCIPGLHIMCRSGKIYPRRIHICILIILHICIILGIIISAIEMLFSLYEESGIKIFSHFNNIYYYVFLPLVTIGLYITSIAITSTQFILKNKR